MGVPAVDPHASSRRLRASVKFARSPFGRWFGINVSSRVDPFLLKVSGGRISTFAGAPVVDVTAPGRKSGEPRRIALLYFTAGEEVILIASSFGREQHPAWYHTVLAARIYPGYADYEVRAAAAGRKIPVVALRPV